LSVIGGGARSTYWGRILAAVLDLPLVYLKGGEVGPALGAAKLAMAAIHGGDPAQYCTSPPIDHVIAPEPDLQDRLADNHQQFRAAYGRISTKEAL
jgi:xylulokinase